MRTIWTIAAIGLAGALCAQISYRNQKPAEVTKQGHVIERLDYDRKIVATNGLPSAAEYRAELAERERMKKVAQQVGPWFDAIQRLEIDQKAAEKKYAADGGGEAGDGTDEVVGQTGQGMVAYVETMRIFNSDTSEGGSLSKDARQLKAALEELLYRRDGEVVCGPSRGVSIKWPLELLLVRYQSLRAKTLPVDKLSCRCRACPQESASLSRRRRLGQHGALRAAGRGCHAGLRKSRRFPHGAHRLPQRQPPAQNRAAGRRR